MKWYGFNKEDAEKILEYLKEKDETIYKKFMKQHQEITNKAKRAKGQRLQKWTCQEIASMLSIKYKQSDDQCEVHSRESGQHGTDIVLRGSAFKRFKYDIECKNQENFNLVPSINQAMANSVEADRDWMLVVRKKAIPETIIIMTWDAFKRLWKRGDDHASYRIPRGDAQ